jgi:hypothetical protein
MNEFTNKDVYMIGELVSGYCDNALCRMDYNAGKKIFEKTLLLKQGYYYYNYITKTANGKKSVSETAYTDGDYSETENTYTILVYYRSLSDRADQLVSLVTIDSYNMSQH